MKIPSKLDRTAYSHPLRRRFEVVILVGVLLCAGIVAPQAQARTAAPNAGPFLASATEDAKQTLETAGKSAMNEIEQLWHKIDEQRLSHRTRDELVGWVIMGLLVGGLLRMVAKLKRPSTLFFGLAGAFLGGIVAHVSQLNLGLGPVLIRYEDLLLSLAGALLLVFLMPAFMKRKESKPKEAKE